MARRRPDDRLEALVSAATQVFCLQGYRRTQMADVARALGVAPGTLYLYAEGKEALFDLVVRRQLEPGVAHPPPALPVRTPPQGSTLAYLRGVLEREGQFPTLAAALGRKRTRDVRAELEAIARELFALMRRNRWGLILLSRSASDWPELAGVFLGGLRHRVLGDLARYLALRSAGKQLVAVTDTQVGAIFITETLAFWVLHRLGDPSYAHISDETAEAVVSGLVVNAFVAHA